MLRCRTRWVRCSQISRNRTSMMVLSLRRVILSERWMVERTLTRYQPRPAKMTRGWQCVLTRMRKKHTDCFRIRLQVRSVSWILSEICTINSWTQQGGVICTSIQSCVKASTIPSSRRIYSLDQPQEWVRAVEGSDREAAALAVTSQGMVTWPGSREASQMLVSMLIPP